MEENVFVFLWSIYFSEENEQIPKEFTMCQKDIYMQGIHLYPDIIEDIKIFLEYSTCV